MQCQRYTYDTVFHFQLGTMTHVAPSLVDNWHVYFDEMEEKMGGGGAAMTVVSVTARGTSILTLILAPNSGSKGQSVGIEKSFPIVTYGGALKTWWTTT